MLVTEAPKSRSALFLCFLSVMFFFLLNGSYLEAVGLSLIWFFSRKLGPSGILLLKALFDLFSYSLEPTKQSIFIIQGPILLDSFYSLFFLQADQFSLEFTTLLLFLIKFSKNCKHILTPYFPSSCFSRCEIFLSGYCMCGLCVMQIAVFPDCNVIFPVICHLTSKSVPCIFGLCYNSTPFQSIYFHTKLTNATYWGGTPNKPNKPLRFLVN